MSATLQDRVIFPPRAPAEGRRASRDGYGWAALAVAGLNWAALGVAVAATAAAGAAVWFGWG